MRTFILGLGTQKTGSTWLYRQIIKSKMYSAGLCKEYHLFDALHLDGFERAIENIAARIKNTPFKRDKSFQSEAESIMKSFYADSNNYYDYFDSILTHDEAFTSDISPSYALLPAEVLLEIKNQFAKRNIALKVIFIMREPISRLESSLKMAFRRNKTLKTINTSQITDEIYAALNKPGADRRGDYRYTCEQIDQVFSADEVFFAFYETMFTESEITRLSQFLNLERALFDVDNIINLSNRSFLYSENDMKRFKELVYDRYDFVSKRFDFNLAKWDEVTQKLTCKTD